MACVSKLIGPNVPEVPLKGMAPDDTPLIVMVTVSGLPALIPLATTITDTGGRLTVARPKGMAARELRAGLKIGVAFLMTNDPLPGAVGEVPSPLLKLPR